MAYQILWYKKSERWVLYYSLDRGAAGKTGRLVGPGEQEYKELGLQPEMDVTKAREVLRVGQEDLKKRERDRRRHEITQRLTERREAKSIYLPDSVVDNFESQVIKRLKIREPHWLVARDYVIKADLHPEKWFEESTVFYALFEKDSRSPDYTRRILRVLNEYGWFYCKFFNRVWRNIPNPRGDWRARVYKAYKRKVLASGREIYVPRLDSEKLLVKESEFQPEEFNWLWVSLWFGLRPREINEYQEGQKWRVKIWHDKSIGKEVLTVFQSKIDDKPKHIPILYPEQQRASKMLQEAVFKQPFIGRVRRILDSPVKLYSGRKGFVNLMDDRGHSLQEVSIWLGHENTETTLRYYWDIAKVFLEKRGDK